MGAQLPDGLFKHCGNLMYTFSLYSARLKALSLQSKLMILLRVYHPRAQIFYQIDIQQNDHVYVGIVYYQSDRAQEKSPVHSKEISSAL